MIEAHQEDATEHEQVHRELTLAGPLDLALGAQQEGVEGRQAFAIDVADLDDQALGGPGQPEGGGARIVAVSAAWRFAALVEQFVPHVDPHVRQQVDPLEGVEGRGRYSLELQDVGAEWARRYPLETSGRPVERGGEPHPLAALRRVGAVKGLGAEQSPWVVAPFTRQGDRRLLPQVPGGQIQAALHGDRRLGRRRRGATDDRQQGDEQEDACDQARPDGAPRIEGSEHQIINANFQKYLLAFPTYPE
ncbi:hypothetical protein D3C86_1336930 [compost metagenome]